MMCVGLARPGNGIAKGAKGCDGAVCLGGGVKPGTGKCDDKTLRLTFSVVDTGGVGEIAVVSSGAPPQMFRDGMGVVVEGRYGHDNIFQSTSLMVKHSNEYRPPKAGEKPQQMYKTLMKGVGS